MIEISVLEARIIGSLIEKEVTTPDQYPLSLKGLTVACNQKSNREPVMNLSEAEVQDVTEALMKKNLVAEVLFGSRVTKYKHRFCNTEFSKMHFNPQELGVICVMLLRGPQTPGELRTRTNRLCKFADMQATENTLERLMSREDGPFVVRLDREPGKRESRYMHLLSGDVKTNAYASVVTSEQLTSVAAEPSSSLESATKEDLIERVELLEEEVQGLRQQFEELKAQWDDFNS